jgi:hypothetical protein
MLRITRIRNTETTTLAISGRIDAEGLSDLRRMVEAEPASHVVLDLHEVSLVDVEVVRFLLTCDLHGVRLTHCPVYIREWMVREKRPR